MSHRTNAHTSIDQVPATDVHALDEAGGTTVGTDSPRRSRRRTPAGFRRPAIYLAAAAAGAIVVNVFVTAEPEAQATAEPVSVAATLGLTSQQTVVADGVVGERLGELAAQRSQREGEQAAAAAAQAAADQAAAEAKAAEEARLAAEAKAAEEARRAAEAKAAEEAAARAAKEAPAPRSGSAAASGSYQEYALSKVGGDSSQFSCLESLWGKESGWNPNAQNPRSTAYGIPQFLNSTWAGTGIAKTSDPYRQIDAGLIYIDSRYGSPCGAWSHSKAKGWY